jgi:hypothetical protein
MESETNYEIFVVLLLLHSGRGLLSIGGKSLGHKTKQPLFHHDILKEMLIIFIKL